MVCGCEPTYELLSKTQIHGEIALIGVSEVALFPIRIGVMHL